MSSEQPGPEQHGEITPGASPKSGRKPPPEEYRWKPGQSGNPGGRPKGESVNALLRRVLEQEHNGKQIKEILIERLVKEAIAGKYNFLREVLDRLEGRPAQRVELSQDEDIHIYYRPLPRVIHHNEPIPRDASMVIEGVDPEKL
jgi:hypothetical protein